MTGYYGPREYEFVRPVKIINFTTGEWMPVDFEIHREDIGWLVQLLNDEWALDFQMKHRFTIPYTQEPGAPSLHEWLAGRGWRVDREEWVMHRYSGLGKFVHLTLMPNRAAAIPGGVGISACSGATLIYDDAEQSMGVTLLAEPRDAITNDEPLADAVPWPTEPEDSRPARGIRPWWRAA